MNQQMGAYLSGKCREEMDKHAFQLRDHHTLSFRYFGINDNTCILTELSATMTRFHILLTVSYTAS